MYKNLSATALGVSGRQSELIELALTYGFRGLDLDIAELVKRAESRGLDYARRYLDSARIHVGGFELPVSWHSDEATYQQGLAQLSNVAAVAAGVGATRCYSPVRPVAELPYHEAFELYRKRLSEIGQVLGEHGIRLGLGLIADPSARQGGQYQFIHQAEPLLLLLKSVADPHIGLALDSWDWHLGGGTLDQVRELGAGQIALVRLADLPAEADPQQVTEEQRLLPGESGVVETASTLATLAELGYDGPVMAYPHPSRFTGMTREAIVQRVSEVLDELWEAAGLRKADKPAEAAVED